MGFYIENGVMKNYTGSETEISIPEEVTEIGRHAFGYFRGDKIVIPDSVKIIGECAFEKQDTLKEIIIPESVTEIGKNAFSNCKRLEEVTIPKSVVKIGENAFSQCPELKKVTILPGATELPDGIFQYCASLSEIRLPETIKAIGKGAFRSCRSLMCINLPDSLEFIGNNAFAETGLEKITIPGKVETLSRGAFLLCPGLREVVLQEGIREIQESAFWKDTGLQSVLFPESLKRIGEDAFGDCIGITKIQVNNLKAWMEVVFESIKSNPCTCCSVYMGFGMNYAKRTEDAKIYVDGKAIEGIIEIPEGIKAINDYAFCNYAGITGAVIPEGVETIGKYAFSGCKNLQEISIPDTVRTIGERAFRFTALRSLTIPSPELDEIGPLCIEGCKQLERIDLGCLPKTVGPDVFKNQSSMTLSFPEGTLATTDKLPLTLCSAALKSSDEEMAYIILFQKTKTWKDWLDTNKPDNPNAVFEKMLNICGREKKRPFDSLAEYLMAELKKLDPELIRKAVSLLEEKKYKDVKDIKKRPEIKAILSGKVLKENPIEARVRELCAKYPVSDNAMKAVRQGIPYAHSKQVSSCEAVAFILSEYEKEWDQCAGEVPFPRYGTSAVGIRDGMKINTHPEADEVAEALDPQALRSFLSGLISGVHYRPWLLAWARFADDEFVEMYTSHYKTEIKGKASEYYKAYSMRECLLINDTRAAMQFFDRIDDLDRYAKKRGKTAMELRDSAMLPDFGFDERGIRSFDTGDNIIEVSITPDLGLKLFNTKTQKEIRSFPKDGENKKKLNAATTQFNEFKESVLGFARARTELIHKMHISGEYIDPENWKNIYLDHLVIRYLTELLIWQDQKGNTFLVDGGKITDAQENSYVPDGKVRVAHVLDMKEADVKAWQQALAGAGKKQLFDQVWEPIIEWDPKTIGTRYTGAVITYQERNTLKKALKQRGIDAGSGEMRINDYHPGTGFSFSNEGEMQIGNCLRIDYHTDPDKKEVTFKRTKLWNQNEKREINADLLELDKAVLSSQITKDNDAALSEAVLSTFTAAQINSFLNLAIKSKATKSTAVLLEYKNNHYPEYAEVNEFSLDW